jgi:3-hydroxyisobutyrate dehydrogenase
MLDALGRWRRMGDLGSGQVTKICNNLLYSATLDVSLATLAAARALGSDPALVRDTLETATGRSFVLGRLPRQTNPTTIDHSVALLEKDRALFETLCDQEGYDASAILEVAGSGLAEIQKWNGHDWSVAP